MFSIFNAPRAYPAAIALYWDRFNFYDGRADWLGSISDIPERIVNLFAVHWLHAEVENGGFWQYFFNSTGTSWPEAIRGFDAINMPDVADLVRSAGAMLGTEFPFDKNRRREIVGEPDNRMNFDSLDCRFWDAAGANTFFRKRPKFVAFADAYAASR